MNFPKIECPSNETKKHYMFHVMPALKVVVRLYIWSIRKGTRSSMQPHESLWTVGWGLHPSTDGVHQQPHSYEKVLVVITTEEVMIALACCD
jgi:hypothetical protein